MSLLKNLTETLKIRKNFGKNFSAEIQPFKPPESPKNFYLSTPGNFVNSGPKPGPEIPLAPILSFNTSNGPVRYLKQGKYPVKNPKFVLLIPSGDVNDVELIPIS